MNLAILQIVKNRPVLEELRETPAGKYVGFNDNVSKTGTLLPFSRMSVEKHAKQKQQF